MPKKKPKWKRKEAASDVGSEISEAAKAGSLLIGSKVVLRELKKGGLRAVVCASNLPEAAKKGMGGFAGSSGIEIRPFEENSAKLGEACGKPFNILMVGIKKQDNNTA